MQTNGSILTTKYTPVEVIMPITPDSKKDYMKSKRSDGNVLYTIKYYQIGSTPDLTKILVGPDGRILAFIDIRRIPPIPNFTLNTTWKWFSIQEWNPELIGDFSHKIAEYQYESFHGCTWTRVGNQYILCDSNNNHQDYFVVKPDNGLIESNVDNVSYTYGCRQPVRPTPSIEKLKQEILLADGTITKKDIRRQILRDIFGRRK